MQFLLIGLVLATSSAQAVAVPSGNNLPIVNLGYVRQQASSFNSTGNYYEFSNIAFAEPPINELRFAPPQAPKPIHGVQNGGNASIMCPQVVPTWLTNVLHLPPTPPAPPQQEDCLYLDVVVPKSIFDKKQGWGGAPVLVWIYGGGFVFGSKTDHNPARLIEISQITTGTEGVIFVAMNYRLGTFGFLAGSEFSSEGGSFNNGLLDQRLALEWVQQNIRKFGGDPNQVTVMGESGGASSIVHQMTAKSSNGQALSVPFERVILQSTAELPLPNDTQNNVFYNQWLKKLEVNSLEDARKLPTAKLLHVNYQMLLSQGTGLFGIGPAIDAAFVRGPVINTLLTEGPNKNLSLITSHNSNEGYIFIPSSVPSNFNFTTWVVHVVPTVSPGELAYITQTLYPPPGPGTPYKTQADRVHLFTGELYVDCLAYGAELAFKDAGYAYQWSIGGGLHALDTYSTFFNNDTPTGIPINVTVANEMQTFFTNFAVFGNPNHNRTKPGLPIYDKDHHMLNFADTGIQVIKDAAANPRCDYWVHRQ